MSQILHYLHRNASLAGPRASVRLLVIVLSPFAALFAGCERESEGPSEPTIVHVKVASPLERNDVVPYEYVRGTTKAVKSVDLYCQVTGFLKEIKFKDGDTVEIGTPLFQIDEAPFKAAYDKANASLEVALANSKFRAAELERNQSLPPGAISKSELDQSIAAKDEADANVTAARAALAQARLDWDYTRISAPVAGRMSKSAISVGNLVVADKTLLSTIVSEDQMYVEYNIDERIFNDIQQQIREGRIKAAEGKDIPVAIKLSSENDYLHGGKMDFIDNAFKSNTGTILLRAVFTNPKPTQGARLLWPNMSVDVRMPLGTPGKALLVAERCIGADLDQKYVYVLDAKNRPEKRMVKLGTMFDGLQVVEDGLKPSDQVIVVGLQNALRPNVTIEKETVKMADYGPAAETAAAPQSAAAVEQPAESPAPTPQPSAAPPAKKGE